MIRRHKKNRKLYLKLLSAKIKINGEWTPCVIYLCLYINRDGMIWVRTREDFENNFE